MEAILKPGKAVLVQTRPEYFKLLNRFGGVERNPTTTSVYSHRVAFNAATTAHLPNNRINEVKREGGHKIPYPSFIRRNRGEFVAPHLSHFARAGSPRATYSRGCKERENGGNWTGSRVPVNTRLTALATLELFHMGVREVRTAISNLAIDKQ